MNHLYELFSSSLRHARIDIGTVCILFRTYLGLCEMHLIFRCINGPIVLVIENCLIFFQVV